MITRRRFCQGALATVVSAGALAIVGCGTEKASERREENSLKRVKDSAALRLLEVIRTEKPDAFFPRYLFALSIAGRYGDVRFGDGRSGDEFLYEPTKVGREAVLVRLNQVQFIELALGRKPSSVGIRSEALSYLVNDASFANNNSLMLNTLVLNRMLEGANLAGSLPKELSLALTNQLLVNRRKEGWSQLVSSEVVEESWPTVDNNTWAVLAGVEPSINLIDSYGRQGSGWVQFINRPVRQQTNAVSTVAAGWGRGSLSKESWDFILGLQKGDGGFASVAGADSSNAIATAEILAFLSANGHAVFGRYLDTPRLNSQGVFYLSTIDFSRL